MTAVETTTFGGEVWTDASGRAVVVLPPYLVGRELDYAYELHTASAADVAAALEDGRLTISSAIPHLKVAWRLAPRVHDTSTKEELQ